MKKLLLYTPLMVSAAVLIVLGSISAIGKPKLRSPYPVFAEQALPANNDCPKAPTSIHDMEYTSVYTDKSQGVSIVDKEAQKKYKKQTKKIRDYEHKLSQWIENSFTKKTNDTHCVLEWLANWAQHNSLLEGKTTFQGEAVRKWTLAVLSSQYIQIKNLNSIDSSKKDIIERWLYRIGNQVISDYNTRPESISRNNNHMFWAAWSVMITAIAINDPNFYDWSVNKYRESIKKIQNNGTLPLEIDRQGKAFHYHVFATAPLIMMAETMVSNGDNEAYEYNSGALHKLVDLILKELNNKQAFITEQTGIKQNLSSTITPSQLAWMEVYYSRFDEKRIEKWLKKLRPMKQRRIGGNMTRLYGKNINLDNDKPES